MTNKEWNPDDPVLKGSAPHELAGVLRWHRNKVPSQRIMRLLGLRGTQFIASLEKGAAQEKAAAASGFPTHAPLMPEEEKD